MVYNITEILEKGSCDITSVKDLAIRLYTAYEVYIPTYGWDAVVIRFYQNQRSFCVNWLTPNHFI